MKKQLALLLTGILLMTAGCAAGGREAAGESKDGTETQTAAQGEEDTSRETSQGTGAEEAGREEETETVEGYTLVTEVNSYTWEEVTVSLPASWEGCYTVKEREDGFSFYQTASYAQECGFIWGLVRTQEPLEEGRQLAAFTDEGMLYYIILPFDVDCISEDEKVLGEYMRMCHEADLISSSLEVAGATCHAEEYVLPTSGILPLHEEDIAGLSDNVLRIARNEIYARHGRLFDNWYLQQYFDSCTWYEGKVSGDAFDDSILTQVERDNLSLLVAAEEAYRSSHPYPKKYSTLETAYEDLDGDGHPEEISYQVSGVEQCLLTVNGEVCDAAETVGYMAMPVSDCFYITDILEGDGSLEIAVMDEGPSIDPLTFFFRYAEGRISYMGQVSGFPFAEYNQGVNGFGYYGNIKGVDRMDMIETVYLEGNWKLDSDTHRIKYRDDIFFCNFLPNSEHELYEDLPVRFVPEESSSATLIPAQEQVFFLMTDRQQWILVKGKDGSSGYMLVKDGVIVDLGKPAEEVFSDLDFFD